jgi:hypothetical protein
MATVLVVNVARLAMGGMRVAVIVMLMRMVMIMGVVMIIMMVMMRMIVMSMIMVSVSRRGRSAHALWGAQHAPFAEECPAFCPQQPRTHRGDQQIAGDLDPPHGIVHGFRRGAE